MHREDETQTPTLQQEYNQLSLPELDDCKTRKDQKIYIIKKDQTRNPHSTGATTSTESTPTEFRKGV